MDTDKVFEELTAIRGMLAQALYGLEMERKRVDRELELARDIHTSHDRDIHAINYILKGNGQKGLLERQRDLEEALQVLRDELVQRRKLMDDRLKEDKEDRRGLARSILVSALSIVIVLAITAIAQGG